MRTSLSKLIKGELAQDWFGKTVVFLNYCITGAGLFHYLDHWFLDEYGEWVF